VGFREHKTRLFLNTSLRGDHEGRPGLMEKDLPIPRTKERGVHAAMTDMLLTRGRG
jgi:hypothetical protein